MRGTTLILGTAGLVLVIAGSIIYGILYSSGFVAFMPLLAGLILSIIAVSIAYRGSVHEGARRSTRYGLNTAISILLAIAIFIFLQTIVTRHSLRIDTTTNGRFSLSPQTRKVLENLESDITITSFFKEASADKIELDDLLSEYRNISPRISFKFVNPNKDPITARRYELEKYGAVFIEAAGKREELWEASEEKITNAIYKVVSSGKKTIYFTTGHGEKSIKNTEMRGLSSLKEALELENFDTRVFLPLGNDRIPDDCTILVMAGPKDDLLQAEQKIILDYLISGGCALFLLDPATDIPVITGITKAFGIKPGDDIIVDPNGKLLVDNYLTTVVNQYGTHPITEDFRLFSFFPQARSLSVLDKLPDATTVTVIGKTQKKAYGETSIDTLMSIGKTQYESISDVTGPVTIAVVGEMELVLDRSDSIGSHPRYSRIIVFGDSDFAGNSNIRMSGNRDLILNSVNWLAEEEDLVSVRPAEVLNQPVLLNKKEGLAVFWIPVVALPSLFGIAGLFVFIRKRQSG
ncbi:MAG: Gldg family protein [Candidatus Krumholzibacteriota bacterium]|nr:Gldg family protein [Candidatus Krumholzibacteriota bacterium]